MKEVLFMLQEDCPYCQEAEEIIRELAAENPAYLGISIRRVDEIKEPGFADTLDYYYVPTFYVDGVKIMEGVPTKDKIRMVMETAIR